MDDTMAPNTIKGISHSSLTLICYRFSQKFFLTSWFESLAVASHPLQPDSFFLLNFYFLLRRGSQRLTRWKYASYSSPKVRRSAGSSYTMTKRFAHTNHTAQ